jgi:hypothetical protein
VGTFASQSMKNGLQNGRQKFSFGVLGYWYFSVHHNIWGKGGCNLKLITNLILLSGLEIYEVLFQKTLHDYGVSVMNLKFRF